MLSFSDVDIQEAIAARARETMEVKYLPATQSHPSSHTKQQQSAAMQASKQPLSRD
jgi:hypothetical protein